jgi:hypothetical protein
MDKVIQKAGEVPGLPSRSRRHVRERVGNEERLLGVLTAAERRTLDRVLKSLLIELERAERRS